MQKKVIEQHSLNFKEPAESKNHFYKEIHMVFKNLNLNPNPNPEDP